MNTPKQTQLRASSIWSTMKLGSVAKSSIKVFFTIIFCIQAADLLLTSLFPDDRVTLVEEISLVNGNLPLDIQVCFKQAFDLDALNRAGYCGPDCYYFGYDFHGEVDQHVIGWGGLVEENATRSSKGDFFFEESKLTSWGDLIVQ